MIIQLAFTLVLMAFGALIGFIVVRTMAYDEIHKYINNQKCGKLGY